jgi:hypothetical protein
MLETQLLLKVGEFMIPVRNIRIAKIKAKNETLIKGAEALKR